MNETNYLNWNNYDTYNKTESLALTMQSPFNEGDRLGSIWKGWFVAPATTNYRFYAACDDYCKLLLGDTSMNSTDPEELIMNWS